MLDLTCNPTVDNAVIRTAAYESLQQEAEPYAQIFWVDGLSIAASVNIAHDAQIHTHRYEMDDKERNIMHQALAASVKVIDPGHIR